MKTLILSFLFVVSCCIYSVPVFAGITSSATANEMSLDAEGSGYEIKDIRFLGVHDNRLYLVGELYHDGKHIGTVIIYLEISSAPTPENVEVKGDGIEIDTDEVLKALPYDELTEIWEQNR